MEATETPSLFSVVRLGLIQHSDRDKDAALDALSRLYLLMGSLASFAIAPPTNEASERARDSAITRANEAMGLTPPASVPSPPEPDECGCGFEVMPGGVYPERRYFHDPDCPLAEQSSPGQAG